MDYGVRDGGGGGYQDAFIIFSFSGIRKPRSRIGGWSCTHAVSASP